LQLAKSQGNVFITDAIMSTLMCATRSVYSWDIIVQKVGKKLFFDKRDESEFGWHTFALLAISYHLFLFNLAYFIDLHCWAHCTTDVNHFL